MESWRKFLKEQDVSRFDVTDDEMKAAALSPPEHGWGGFEREVDPEKLAKDKEMMAAAVKLGVDKDFPIVNGKNFELPITGFTKVGSDYNAKRAGGPHLALDQFVKAGTELVAITDGTIINNNSNTYQKSVEALAKLINTRRDEGKLIDDINISMNGTVASFRKKDMEAKAGDRQKKLDKFNSKFTSNNQIKDAPSDWEQMRDWANKHLGYKLMPTLLRYYNKKISYSPKLPIKGLGFTLITDPDQHGNRFGFSYAHLKEAPKTGRVKQGEFVGTVGNTAIFDLGIEHLHLGAFVKDDTKLKIADSAWKRSGRWIDPGRIIRGLGAMRDGVYAEVSKDKTDDPAISDAGPDFRK